MPVLSAAALLPGAFGRVDSIGVTIGRHTRLYYAYITTAPAALEPLSAEQIGRVIGFWERCVKWADGRSKPPGRLLSALASLAGFLKTAEGRDFELLSAVAPFVHVDHGAYQFFEELTRLVPTSPAGVATVLGRFLEAHVPDFDYQDRLKTLLTLLAAQGQKQEAVKYAEVAREVLGMQAVFDQLTRGQ